MNNFSKRLREALSVAKMTQSELSQKTGIPKSAMSEYCSGAYAPKWARLVSIAEALGVSHGWLAGLDVPMHKQIIVCPDCGWRYDAANPTEVDLHGVRHANWKAAANLFGFFWPRNRRDEEEAKARNRIESGNLNNDEYIEAQETIFKVLFSLSLESSGLSYYDHLFFEDYVAALLNQETWKKQMPSHIYAQLKDRYGTNDFIPDGSFIYEPKTRIHSTAPAQNTVTLSGRDGSIVEKHLDDQQFAAVKTLVEQLPETE